ncbi:flagellar hook-associated protein FlgK [Peribacillus saganii]|uniref:Flagellar hook-associated protein 1 n=1 Tax=Peribacillus saganii TaxID=2303992 RepID=A0A372LM66_9BACI|nr:flagellar hook-associated protein FlgK [Peribacillus saganii]RFU68301.1 flagellar hook-associated protein FlgK [Peribacillus saganii]
MRSTFMGLEIAKRGMFTQQGALYTTGHNIANANTPGYTRQRINFTQTEPYPAASLNRPQIPGQMGTGVATESVQRVREGFLDIQYRNENNKLGYWESRSKALSKLEDIMNEPTQDGLAAVMNEFSASLQDLATYPEKEGTRKVVLERGRAIADTFHYLSDSLNSIKRDYGNQINDVSIKEVNSILEEIAGVNKQISEIEPHGYLPNDLYDQRDLLIDQISSYLNITVERRESGGNDLPVAEGIYDVKILNQDGTTSTLVAGAKYGKLEIGSPLPEHIAAIKVTDSDQNTVDVSVPNFSQGKLRGLVEAYGYVDNGSKGIYTQMLSDLDNLATAFAEMFNTKHNEGYILDKANAPTTLQGDDFFGFTSGLNPAKGLQVIISDTNQIAASKDGYSGDGKNALELASIQGKPAALLGDATINSFYEGIIGQLGVDALKANRLTNNSEILRQSVEEKKSSVSSVSLDEEMTNMIKFQHAYNAAARNITIVDEMLDKIINGMGTGGR